MAISSKEIEATLLAKGFEPVDISMYKNLDSTIEVQCNDGHKFNTSFRSVRKANFVCPVCEGKATSKLRADLSLPKKDGFRIIALDQSSTKTGISVFDNGKLVYYHLVEVTGTFPVRLKKLYQFIRKTVITEWQPNYLVFEDIYQDNVLTFKMLAMVLGICILAAEETGIEHTEIMNKVWQKEYNIGGSNRVAQKRNVVARVKEYYNLDVTDDVADAILLGKYAAKNLESRWARILF